MSLKTFEVQCPYCGEMIEADIEVLAEKQSFIEDCSVCCRPIQYAVSSAADGEAEVVVSRSQ